MNSKDKYYLHNPVYYKNYEKIVDLSESEYDVKNILPDNYNPQDFQHVPEKQVEEIVAFAKKMGILNKDMTLVLSEGFTLNATTDTSNPDEIMLLCDVLMLDFITILPMLILHYRKCLDNIENFDEAEARDTIGRIKFIFKTYCINKQWMTKESSRYAELCCKNDIYAYQAAMYSNALFIYLICHEIGHIANNDTGLNKREIAQEIAADKIGCHLFYEILRHKEEFKFSYLDDFVLRAPLLLLDIFALAQEIIDKENNMPINQYNEYRVRKMNLLANFTFNFQQDETIVYVVFNDILEEIRNIMIFNTETI